ncbi:MAG: porin family protein [Sphingomonadales bacterium]|nr:porin family protein [Sphingomonadales bacterium]
MKYLLAVLMAALFVVPAQAENRFGGLSAGVLAGYSDDNLSIGDGDLSLNLSADSITPGLFVGYDLAVGNLSLGVQADATFNGPVSALGDADFGADLTYGGSARLGYALANGTVLAYGRLGVSFTEFSFEDPGAVLKSTETGLVYGGGLEWSPTRWLFLGAEYRRTDYGRFGDGEVMANPSRNEIVARAGLRL